MSGAAAPAAPLIDAALISRVVELLREDRIVGANIRWRRARFLLAQTGAPGHGFVVDRGSISADAGADADADGGAVPEVRISGTADQWQTVLGGRHGGLHRAWRYRDLEFDGDPVATFDLWKTVWRLGDALASAAKERGHAV